MTKCEIINGKGIWVLMLGEEKHQDASSNIVFVNRNMSLTKSTSRVEDYKLQGACRWLVRSFSREDVLLIAQSPAR
jgi:hypothetical protein